MCREKFRESSVRKRRKQKTISNMYAFTRTYPRCPCSVIDYLNGEKSVAVAHFKNHPLYYCLYLVHINVAK